MSIECTFYRDGNVEKFGVNQGSTSRFLAYLPETTISTTYEVRCDENNNGWIRVRQLIDVDPKVPAILLRPEQIVSTTDYLISEALQVTSDTTGETVVFQQKTDSPPQVSQVITDAINSINSST